MILDFQKGDDLADLLLKARIHVIIFEEKNAFIHNGVFPRKSTHGLTKEMTFSSPGKLSLSFQIQLLMNCFETALLNL